MLKWEIESFKRKGWDDRISWHEQTNNFVNKKQEDKHPKQLSPLDESDVHCTRTPRSYNIAWVTDRPTSAQAPMSDLIKQIYSHNIFTNNSNQHNADL